MPTLPDSTVFHVRPRPARLFEPPVALLALAVVLVLTAFLATGAPAAKEPTAAETSLEATTTEEPATSRGRGRARRFGRK